MNNRDYKADIPEGANGKWSIERFTITKKDAAWSVFSYRARTPPPGTYTRLMRKGSRGPIMSDTPAEIRDLRSLFYEATGSVLINGLGLGIALQGCMLKSDVEYITVIEISQDLIDLVGSYYEERYEDRLTIICADAFEYKSAKGIRFNVVWHDIWDNICTDNLPEMHKLHRKYGRRTDWQGSWGRGICEMYR